ncbi:prephenate dehydrogenase/arogenate dehydrogenase family protein, partial [Saccharomonospora iraqiensis]
VARTAPECALTDVVSVKAPVRDAVRRLLPSARFAGGHPMAGTAES